MMELAAKRGPYFLFHQGLPRSSGRWYWGLLCPEMLAPPAPHASLNAFDFHLTRVHPVKFTPVTAERI